VAQLVTPTWSFSPTIFCLATSLIYINQASAIIKIERFFCFNFQDKALLQILSWKLRRTGLTCTQYLLVVKGGLILPLRIPLVRDTNTFNAGTLSVDFVSDIFLFLVVVLPAFSVAAILGNFG
jgi:hypothetical protein